MPPHMSANDTPSKLPLLTAAFRPFFLLAAAGGVALVGMWVAIYAGGGHALPADYFDPLTWHHHELIYGYTLAVIAGFLLTAVSNWTKQPPLAGVPLALLALLWIAGRIVVLTDLPPAIIAAVDLSFAPALAVAVAIPLVRSGNHRNLVFIVLLAVMIAGNILVHLQALGSAATARLGAMLGLYVILLMITVVAGRVVPFFIERRFDDTAPRRWPRLGWAAIVALLTLAALDLSGAPAVWVATAAWIALVVHGVRMVGWHVRRLWAEPLLWVLFVGYGWLVGGFALRALAATGAVTPFVATHAWTVGAIGVMTLGMMTRVSLGHTGRPLRAPPVTTLIFIAINAAAIARVLGPIVWPEHAITTVRASAALWMLAMFVFLIAYTPVLMRQRKT